MALAVAIISWRSGMPRLAGILARLGSTADLAVANARYVTVIPQALFEGEPEVLKIIREAERKEPSPGPYRVYRMPIWNPPDWITTSSDDRCQEFVAWERGTLQPKYGINDGVEHTHTVGVAELYDYEWFFGGSRQRPGARRLAGWAFRPARRWSTSPAARSTSGAGGISFLPWYPNGWRDEARGFAAFLEDSELIYPSLERMQDAKKKNENKAWIKSHDYQVRRNLKAYPRAWVVHEARSLPVLEGLTRAERSGPMQDMLYNGDKIWNDSGLPLHDPHRLIWIDMDDQLRCRNFLSGLAAHASETVKVTYPRPDRVELETKLDTPGVVVLADVYYPGWKLSIDGRPAPIYRVNRMMRARRWPKGEHRLVYTFEPGSFKIGAAISLAGLAVSVLLAGYCSRHDLGGAFSMPAEGAGADLPASWSCRARVVK